MRHSKHLFQAFMFVIIFHSCDAPETIKETKVATSITEGDWMVYFDIDKDIIPINVEFFISEKGTVKANIINDTEKIALDEISLDGDSMIIEMPLFNSKFFTQIHSADSLSGYWVNYNKSADYKVPVTFVAGKKNRFSGMSSTVSMKERWKVVFSPNSEDDKYDAIGIFKTQNSNGINGTFLTETGDYRFLDGNIVGDSLMLSCFDGAHLFLFKAKVLEDSLLGGIFYSGNHYDDTWVGVPNSEYELRDPNHITSIVNEKSWRNVKVKTIEGQEMALGGMGLENKVSIVQIMGTWCPNCVDESKYFKELHQKYGSEGLNIVPVCFEKEDIAIDLMTKFKERLELPYPIYLGGKRSKKAALEVFPMLNDIISFPTSLIIDKVGKVRKIHTGFYGPGTGHYYKEYVDEMDSFVSTLLKE